MRESNRFARRVALAAAVAIVALTAAAVPLKPANADEWRRHAGWGGYGHGWYAGPSFSFYAGPSYYYAPPPPAYYYPPPPAYYPPPPVYYSPPAYYAPYAVPFLGFSINIHGH